MSSEKLLLKVLFIEDDESFFGILKPRVQKEGFFVIWARDGEEGIQKACIELPDLIVVDIVMPKLNGFEVIKTLKENALTRNLKFIILSNYGETSLLYDKDFLETLGIKKYLIKSNHTPTQIAKEIKSVVV